MHRRFPRGAGGGAGTHRPSAISFPKSGRHRTTTCTHSDFFSIAPTAATFCPAALNDIVLRHTRCDFTIRRRLPLDAPATAAAAPFLGTR